MISRFHALALLLAMLFYGTSHAQDFAAEPLLKVVLVPEVTAIAPGKPFTIAVKVQHADKAHSYWKNPGGPGKAMKLKWTLPVGFSASETEWPAPHAITVGTIISYTFEKETVALVTITPSGTAQAGDTAAIEVVADGLVCVEVCTLVKIKANLSLPIAAVAMPNAAAPAVIAAARKLIPDSSSVWDITASNEGGKPTISLKPQADANDAITKAYFFSDTEVIDSQKPQVLSKQGDHWVLALTPAADDPPKDELSGLLVAEEGWLKSDPSVKAFAVKLPFGKASASNPTSAPATITASTEQRSVPILILFAFIGGLILNIMPCVFPVLGIKIMGFVQQAGHDRRKIFLHGLAYTAGVLVCFWVLAIFVITLGKGWGAQLQSHGVLLALCYFFLAFGLNMAGVFEVGTSAVGVGQGLQKKSGLGGSFFSGLLATIVATPCSAPFLGPALAWALSLPAITALLVFTVIGLGLSSPYLVLSLAPSLVKLLPRPGAWMESFKQGMSFMLFGTAGYMFWVLSGKMDASRQLNLILGMVLIAMACWIYGRWFLPHKSAKARTLGLSFTVLALVTGLYLGWPQSEQEKKEELVWQPWSQELVKTLRDKGEPVYIDFTARWCATCQLNKHVYKDPEVKALFKAKHVNLLKADWTDENEVIRTVLRDEYKRAAIPVNPFYLPGAKEPIILSEALTVDEVKKALSLLK